MSKHTPPDPEAVAFYKSFDKNNDGRLDRHEAVLLFQEVASFEYSQDDCRRLLNAAFPHLSMKAIDEEMLTESILKQKIIPRGATNELNQFRELLTSSEARIVFKSMESLTVQDIEPYSQAAAIAKSCVQGNMASYIDR